MPIIKLKSYDGEIFDTDSQIVKCSGAIKTLLEEYGIEDGGNAVIPLPRVHSVILRKVLQWANYHKCDTEPPQVDNNKGKRTVDICPWDVEFLKVDQGTLIGLISAAQYLDIKVLLDVTCQTLANIMDGMSIEELRRILYMKNDFTPAEEAQVRMEDESCEQK